MLDLVLFTLMSTLLPIRLFLLVISTPFRLLAERNAREDERPGELADDAPHVLTEGGWRDEVQMSVTEHTTTLFDTGKIRR